jgi:3-phenylpropionate/trans-cinnamate dioxygenase ferredoxin subunit
MERFKITTLDELTADAGQRFDVAGHRIAVFRIGADLYAIGDRCSHAEASLADGEIFDGAVECPRHGSEFNLTTGEPDSFPATQSVPVYEVTVEGTDVFVSVDPIDEEDA